MKISYPEIVTFRITSACNNDCKYCYGPKDVPALSFVKLRRIFALLAGNGVKAIVITGGEPLLRDDIDQIFFEIKRLRMKLFLDTTSDYFFSHSNAINRCVSMMGLPLDYASNKSYRNRNNFENISNVLKYYKEAKMIQKPLIRIGTVVTRENADQIMKIGDYIRNFPVDIWKIYQFIPIGKNATANQSDLLIENSEYLRIARGAQQRFSKYFDVLISPRESRASAYFMINPDGKVIMPMDDQYGCREVVVGDIFEKDILSKWHDLISENNYLNNAKPTFVHQWSSLPMKPIYNQIWHESKKYNSKGRIYTEGHIEWLLTEALELIKNEKVDESILVPLLIMHDVGYSRATTDNPFRDDSRVGHMKAGSNIARRILEKVGYSRAKTDIISKLISIHDVWAFGDNEIYRSNREMGLFNDLDFTSMLAPTSVGHMAKYKKISKESFVSGIIEDEKIVNRPFVSQSTQEIFEKQLVMAH